MDKANLEMVKLGEILTSQPKSKIKAGDGLAEGKYMFFTSSNIQSKFFNTYQYDKPALIFGTGGNASVHFCNEPFSTSTDCLVFYAENNQILKTIYLYLSGNMQVLEEGFKGAGLKHISKEYILNIEIPIPPLPEQIKIATELDKITDLISKRKAQIEKLDLLVKSKFVEMFGDPVTNPMGWEVETLDKIATIKIGPFGSLLHKQDYVVNGHAIVNPSHILDGEIIVDNELTISNEKYEEMSAYKLEINDIVLGRRGEMGRCAVVKNNGLLCGTGSIIIRPNGKILSFFLQKIISYPTYKKSIEDSSVGVTMMNLNVPIVSSFNIPVLPLALQTQFADQVQKVESIKENITKSLEKLETLKKARMQFYFG